MKVSGPDGVAVGVGILLGEGFAAAGAALGAGGHAVLVVAEFVEQDVKEEEGAAGGTGEVERMGGVGVFLNRDGEAVEEVEM